ncbi:MAG TPA: tRNA (adenosine(37)-N6)-dimethylallyltransferase MiaA [Candidatus Borkfalkia excrementipullorum]|nr:tRNA (adenosine(37)-N6)-dimethylallyltransferase MiaA [Candidatus Borkfalkia excrementipullorum]
MKKILVVCGPTASGKTGFAVQMAQKLHSEVISADCMLVYRGFDIGTAKPTEKERAGVPHHLIDVVGANEKFSASDYEALARPVCERLLAENKNPVVCGGTGFYIQSLLFSRSLGNVGASEEVRRKYERMEIELGKEAVFARLQAVDSESAAKLHPNDVKRVIRALEIFELTGKKKSEQEDGFVARYPYVAVAFDYPREELYARIDARVEQMLQDGLVEEVQKILADGTSEQSQSMQGIGYKEVVQFLKKEISYSTMRDVIKQNSRNYAKRQITFFKKFPGLVWLEPSADNIAKVTEILI